MSFFAAARPPCAQALAVGVSPFVAIVHLPSSAWATPPALNPTTKAAMRNLQATRLMSTPCDDRPTNRARQETAYNLDAASSTNIRSAPSEKTDVSTGNGRHGE